ncbi:hypothetical protein ACHHYP_04242 [Achlya hypogyna]|uniref:Uncharacterized protein n=1 Tax=Achlya hypogyna TaxID=1202772 RepID=A0A1V9ZPD6_ACHHY|nr:hypothetical protein ACHHYP_04242 [Achlya hypogyna]
MTSDVDARGSLCSEANAYIYLLPEDVPGGLLGCPVYARLGAGSSSPVTTLPCPGVPVAISLPALSLGNVVSEEEALVSKTGLWFRQSVVFTLNEDFYHGQVIAYDVPTRMLTVRASTGLYTVHQHTVTAAPYVCALLLWPFAFASAEKLAKEVHPRLLAVLGDVAPPILPALLDGLVDIESVEDPDAVLPQAGDVRLWTDTSTGRECLTTLQHVMDYYRQSILGLVGSATVGASVCDDPTLREKTAAPAPFHRHCGYKVRRALFVVCFLAVVAYVVYYVAMGKVEFRDFW